MIAAGGVLILLSDFVYKWWLSSTIKPDKSLMFLLLLYFCIQLSWARYGSIINGIGCVKLQFYITMIEAFVHIPLALSLIISSFANTIWPKIQINNIFLGNRSIWVM